MNKSKIRVGEMFAGVGGFHLGLKRASQNYEVVWADQFEPARANQFAYNIYKNNFPETNISNEDISKINKATIPDMELLVGGFPCQDYSVATTKAKGLFGKKGVLWWDIKDVIEAKWPPFIFLENVDRLLTSPGVKSTQPGRDFGMILRTLADLGYGVTWKMINAADYGFPQRRRRTFIFAFREDTKFLRDIHKSLRKDNKFAEEFLKNMAPFSNTLKVDRIFNYKEINLYEYKKLVDFSNFFSLKNGFRKTGLMVDGQVYMADYEPKFKNPTTLGEILLPVESGSRLYLDNDKIKKFESLKNGFSTIKTSRSGFEYKYGMGKIAFPDDLDKPARTMVTSEHTVSRMSHVVEDPSTGDLRVISPEEAEKINTFPQKWTELDGVSPSNRYFAMGNALVVNLVKEIGIEIDKINKDDDYKHGFQSSNKVEKILH